MDLTLLTILGLLAFATILAVVQARKRDKCLKDFQDFHVTLAEKDGDLCWGCADIYATGLEITYVEPVVSQQGHLERSFIFYKEQYEALDALYRYPEGLPEAEQARRRKVIEQTANPGVFRRLARRIQNWVSMVRDALMQAITMVIGVAKSSKPGAAVLSSQESQLKALSSEVIGHVGNAFDPLLERHLFSQVVLEVTRGERTYSYCGWLKDYTSRFIEVVDAFANAVLPVLPLTGYHIDDDRLQHVTITHSGGRIKVQNQGERMLFVERIEAPGWNRPMGCVLPPHFRADLALPFEVPPAEVSVWIGSMDRVDLVVPRAHAIIRHAADGSEGPNRQTHEASVTAQATKGSRVRVRR